MVNSDRTRWKGDLLVGRQPMTDNGVVVNDIVLDTDDLAVSRVHFGILYEDGFNRRSDGSPKKRMIPKLYIEFFKIFSDKHLARNPEQVYLPPELRMVVISYLRRPRSFYMQDMGSIHGTFVKMKHNEPKKLVRGLNFQLGGAEIYLNIIDVQLPSRNQQITFEHDQEYSSNEASDKVET
jgi:hypothetical protein